MYIFFFEEFKLRARHYLTQIIMFQCKIQINSIRYQYLIYKLSKPFTNVCRLPYLLAKFDSYYLYVCDYEDLSISFWI